ncbi:hypothetical protein C0J52_25304 [Blattella germanica]|nr:hypothetical protein C0J52_25304 [Blattella germanica]
MRNEKNACIVQLAFAEILSLSLNIALSYWDVANNTWQLNESSCKVFIMSKDLVVSLVVFSVLALTLERFMVVRASFKLKYFHAFRDFGPTLLLVTVWIYSIVTRIPSYVSATLYNRCLPSPPGTDYERKILAFQLTVNSITPVFLTIVLNIATAYMLKKSIDKVPGEFWNETRDNNRNTVANMVSVLSIVFTMSYLPNAILRTLVSWFSWSAWTNEDIFWYSLVSYCLFFIHTIFNPLAIIVMGSKFRVHILKLTRFFTNENPNIPENLDIQQSMDGPCHFLLNLGEGFAGTTNESHAQQITLPLDPEAHDKAARRARQERRKKIKERFRLKLRCMLATYYVSLQYFTEHIMEPENVYCSYPIALAMSPNHYVFPLNKLQLS